MTRTHKSNDVPHNHPEAEAAFSEHAVPKFFGKSGFVDQAPTKVKKNGSGKGNWGRDGDEIQDLDAEFATFKARRRSNSKGHLEDQFVRSKFEMRDDEPVFDEEVHGAPTAEADGAELESVATTDSNASSTSSSSNKA